MERMGRRKPLAVAAGAALLALSGYGQVRAADAPPPPPREWADQVKNPVSWFKWGADTRIRHEAIYNPFFFDTDPPGNEWQVDRFRTRVWATLSPCKEFDFNIRLTNEAKHYWQPDSRDEWDENEFTFDSLNGRIKLPDYGATLTIGRQDIILGDAWLVLDGTPLDGSRTIFFDAARLTLDLKEAKSSVDVIGIYQFSDPDTPIAPIFSKDMANREQDETGAILWLTNKSIEKTELNAYFIYKHDNAVAANGDDGDIYTIGARGVRTFNQNWSGRIEGAYQWGQRDNPALFGPAPGDLSAYGLNSRLTYSLNDDMKNQFYGGYEFLSGDDPDSSTVEQFDPLWGRWPQWSELWVYLQATENRIAETTNLHHLFLGWAARPVAKMDATFSYHALWAAENSELGRVGFGSSDFRGHLLSAMVKYTFNRFISGHVYADYLFTGNYYREQFPRNDDNAAFLRAEIVFTF